MKIHESDNGIVGYKTIDGEYSMIIPASLLNKLQAAWQADDEQGSNFGPIVEAVCNLFDGQDARCST